MDKINFRFEIIDIIQKENKRPIPAGIILKKIEEKFKSHTFKKDVYSQIDKLLSTGEIVKLNSEKIVMGYPLADVDMSTVKIGTIAINAKRTGFITLEKEIKSSYFVHNRNLGGALDGDTVEFAKLSIPPREGQSLIDAKVLKVLKHKKDYFVGCYVIDEKGYHVQCDDEKMYLPITLTVTDGLVNGTKFLFKVENYQETSIIVVPVKIIGHISDVGTDILSVVYNNGVEPEFNDEVLDFAKNISLNIESYQRKIRKDLTNLPIVTIDPATSKDFDDAIYVEQEGNNYRLFVSIADVSHYVSWNSVLDQEALKRGCSIYLVDRVIPMLPHNLSDDICSLNPNVERLSITCEMLIDQQGSFVDIKVYPSIMKSARRFSYDEVNKFFENNEYLKNDKNEVKQMLLVSRKLHEILTKMKNTRGYIEFEIPEPKIIVNEKCEPIKIELRESGIAQKMIEDFMVAANEAVSVYAINKKWPFVFRVHDHPEESNLKAFAIEAKKLNFNISKDITDIQPDTIAKWLQNNKQNSNFDLINILLLRTMSKAKYDTVNIGHFGLASKHYTHFTSPIRRYPDLLVHRIYWMYEFERSKYTDTQRLALENALKDDCQTSNKNELTSIKTEREVNDMKFAEFMQKHIGEEFEATVTTVTAFGIFIQLENTIEGLIRIANMKNDFYVFNENDYTIIGRTNKQRFTLGTKLIAKVISANKQTKKIEFELVKFLKNR